MRDVDGFPWADRKYIKKAIEKKNAYERNLKKER
jgi:hypothetical protein